MKIEANMHLCTTLQFKFVLVKCQVCLANQCSKIFISLIYTSLANAAGALILSMDRWSVKLLIILEYHKIKSESQCISLIIFIESFDSVQMKDPL